LTWVPIQVSGAVSVLASWVFCPLNRNCKPLTRKPCKRLAFPPRLGAGLGAGRGLGLELRCCLW
jgi:hypothetical protein